MTFKTLNRRRVLTATGALLLAPSAAANTTGFETAGLERVASQAAALDQLHSLVIGRGGEIAFAEAFRGPALERPVNVKSVSKTIVASLTGAALDRGVFTSVEQPVAPLLGAFLPADADPRLGDITVADLLTMQAGLERTSGGSYGQWVQSDNWVAYALARPFVAAPGSRMLYSTGSYHLLGAALARVANRSLLALARDWLGAPLGIDFPPWTRDPQGFFMGGNNMALSPLELWRFGELWRQGGRWDGTQVLSEQWIEASWEPRTRSPWSGDLYGYGWFLARTGRHDVAYARGYGGQMLYVLPELGLTVAVTSDPNRPARSGGYVGELHALLAETIVPAAERA